jgi:membrane peptidoglycan carboxypeptidase
VFKQKVEPFFVYYIRNLILDNADGEFDAFGQRRIERVHTLYQGGLNIYTSLEPSWQEYAEEAVDASPAIHPGRNSPDVSLVSVRATDGAIKAMLSGKNYNRDQYDLVWRGTRQVGSAFKPFTLTAAFEQGFPPGKVYSSKSPLCNLEGWRSASGCVSNAEGGGDRGYLDLWSATQDSVNVVFAQLALDVGPEHIVDVATGWGSPSPWTPSPRSRSASRRSRRWTWRPRSGRSRTTASAATRGPSDGWSSPTSRGRPRRTNASCTSTSPSASR